MLCTSTRALVARPMSMGRWPSWSRRACCAGCGRAQRASDDNRCAHRACVEPAMTESRIVWMLVAMSAATFVITSSGSATAPFMPAIAADLATDIPAIAHLFSVQALTWGGSALLFGMLSDRVGRRSTLVVSVVLLG